MRCFLTFVILGVIASTTHAGEKMPSQADVRKAIERALPFVEKDGLAWIKRRDCMSCHVVAFMLWAHVEAKSAGIKVDQTKLDEWTKWSYEKSLATRVNFKLVDKTLKSLPAELQPKLNKLVDEGFTLEDDYVKALARSLSPEELKLHQPMLVKVAKQGKKTELNDGGGLDTMAQLFLARDPSVKGSDASFFKSTAELMLALQTPAGTWSAAGQQPARRWPRPAADQTTTMWAILALSGYEQSTPAITKGLEKAHGMVKKFKGDPNFEWLVARLLYEHKFGSPAEVANRKAELLKRQNADGGFSALPGGKSEAFSTGQGLYALHVIGVTSGDNVIRRGQKFLLDTQNPDGSWVQSPALTSNGNEARHKKLEPIWRNWASSWATIGLARTLEPKK